MRPLLLVVALLAAYLPFLNLRVLRMAGDEKVYTSQALEMVRDGRWFVQTLADEPNYFKGPLHYICLHLGTLVFGNQLIATTWMNLFFILLASLSIYYFLRFRWSADAALLLALAVGLNVGVFSHAFASQMEVELCAFYTFAMVALGWKRHASIVPAHPTSTTAPTVFNRTEVSLSQDFIFWIIAGMAGWIKSPVYSVFLGFSAILFWLFTNQLLYRLRSPKHWVAMGMGILVCILGYLPAYILDQSHFLELFIYRENLHKANNNRSWTYVTLPLLHFALPWTVIILGGFGTLLSPGLKKLDNLIRQRLFKKTDQAESAQQSSGHITVDAVMIKLGLAMALPTFIFWICSRYKGQNYNLPILSALLLISFAVYREKIPKIFFQLTGAMGVIGLFIAAYVIFHFLPLPYWWPIGWLVLIFLSLLAFTVFYLWAASFRMLLIGTTAFFISFAAFIVPLGEREMLDIRKILKENSKLTYHYYNLDPSIWNEWGLLQYTLNQPIYGLHKQEHLKQATQPGHAVIVQSDAARETVLKYWWENKQPSTSYPAHTQNNSARYTSGLPRVIPWTRWLTKGKASDGTSRWKAAWASRDLTMLERTFYVIVF